MSESRKQENDNEISFEDAIDRLESIVEKMNDQSLPLEKAISLYEEGMTLSQKLTDTIETAEQKVIEINERLDSSQNQQADGSDREETDDEMPF